MADRTTETGQPTELTSAQKLEKKLEEARARRAAIAEAREKKNADKLLEAELAAEVQGIEDDEVIAKLEDELGPEGRAFKVIRTDLGAVIVKRSTAAAFKMFQDLRARENPKVHQLSDQLTRPCLLHPSKDRFDEMLKEQPHILIRCTNAIAELAGVRAEEVAGK